MSKQKIIILIGVLVIVFIAIIFYFILQRDTKIENEVIENTPLTQEEIDARATEALESFPVPDLKFSDTEIKESLNSIKPKQPLTSERIEKITSELESAKRE